MVSEGSGTSGQAEEGLFAEKKETPKGWTPFGLEEEADGVLRTEGKTLPPRSVVVAGVAVVFAAAVAEVTAFVVVVAFAAAAAEVIAFVVAAGLAVVVAAAVALVIVSVVLVAAVVVVVVAVVVVVVAFDREKSV